MPIDPTNTNASRRLTRVQQLTLNTWRWAVIKLQRADPQQTVIQQAALHAVLAALRDVKDPLELFSRHSQAHPEFRLILSVLPHDRPQNIEYDILDAAFLMRWTELLADGDAPEELPPLGAPDGIPSRSAD